MDAPRTPTQQNSIIALRNTRYMMIVHQNSSSRQKGIAMNRNGRVGCPKHALCMRPSTNPLKIQLLQKKPRLVQPATNVRIRTKTDGVRKQKTATASAYNSCPFHGTGHSA